MRMRAFPDDRYPVLLIVGVWCAMVVAVNPIGDFPLNDDWVYAAAVRNWLEHGRFEVHGFSSANVGPLVYWGALFAEAFGFSFTTLRASTLVLGLIGGLEIYALYRLTWRSRTGATLAALTVLVDPIWFALSNTFMTDVPFVVLMLGAVLALIAGFQRDSARLLVVGIALAMLDLLMRQFGVVVLCAFAAGYVVRYGLRWKTLPIALAPLALGLLLNAAFTYWLLETGRKPAAGGAIATLMPESGALLVWQVRMALFVVIDYMGFMAAPLLVAAACAVWWLPRSRRRTTTLVATVVVAASIAHQYVVYGLRFPLVDNTLNRYGIGPLTNGDTFVRSVNLPPESAATAASWTVLTLVTVFASAAFVVALASGLARLVKRAWQRRERPASPVLASGVLIAACGVSYFVIVALIAIKATLFDRYLLPLFVLAVLAGPLLLPNAARRLLSGRGPVAIAAVGIALAAVYTVVCTHDYLAWNRVRWAALQDLVAGGVAPQRIDGGYEFNGWYLYDPSYRKQPGKSWWWVHDDEFQATFGPLDGYRPYRRYPVPRWWDHGADVQILRRQAPPESPPLSP